MEITLIAITNDKQITSDSTDVYQGRLTLEQIEKLTQLDNATQKITRTANVQRGSDDEILFIEVWFTDQDGDEADVGYEVSFAKLKDIERELAILDRIGK